MSDRLQAAHGYVRQLDFAVIPVHHIRGRTVLGAPICSCGAGENCKSAGKHPMAVAWTKKAARTGPDVQTFWDEYPGANVGIVCGSASSDGTGDLVVLDVDVDKGGLVGYTKLFTSPPGEFRLVPPTRRHETGGGGFHLFYRLPSGVHLTSRPLSGDHYPGIDIRAEDGMVVAPPSVSGKGAYTTEDGDTYRPSRIPQWLLDVLLVEERGVVAWNDDGRYATPQPADPWELPGKLRDKLAEVGIARPHRSDRFYNLVSDLREAGLTEGQAITLMAEWCALCDPPLYLGRLDKEVHRVWGKHQAKVERMSVGPVDGYTTPNLTSLAYAYDPAPDPAVIAQAREAIAEALEAEPGEFLDLSRLSTRVGDLGEAAALAATYEMVDWEGLLTKDLPAPEWLIPQLVERGRFVCLYAPEGVGKSLLMQQQMGAAVAGKIISGDDDGPSASVLYLDQENNIRDLHSRYLAGGFKHEELERLFYSFADEMPYLHTRDGARHLISLVLKYRVDVVVIDTFARFVEGEQNAPEAPNAFFRLVAKPLTDAGLAVVVLDHTAKDIRTKGPIGSRAKTATPHVVWKMEKRDDGTLRLTNEKDRAGNCPEFLRVVKNSNPLDFEIQPMTKQQIEQEDFLGRNSVGGKPATKGPGRPRKSVDEKAQPIIEKLDRHRIPLDAKFAEAAQALRALGETFNRSYLGLALRLRRGEEGDQEDSDEDEED